MIFTFIDGNVEVSDKLLRECMADLKDTYPDMRVRVMTDSYAYSDAMQCVIDWMERNEVEFEEGEDLPSTMSPTPDRVYALIGDTEPSPEVAEVLKSALEVGVEVRDLAEAGVTVVRIDGTVPTPTEGANMADEDEENYTWLQLGLAADDPESDILDQAQETIDAEFTKRGLDGEAYEDWVSMAVELGVADGEEDSINFRNDANNEGPDEEAEVEDNKAKWTLDDLKDLGVRKLREIAKASNIDPKLPREDIIDALVNGGATKPIEGGETFEDRGPVDEEENKKWLDDKRNNILPGLHARVEALEAALAKLKEALS